MVHRMFRRELLLSSGVVRRVDSGDARRAHSVAAHLRFISATLHHHHSSEDRYVWPLLKQRAPAQLSEHVTAAMQQHRHVHAVQAQVDAELPIWSCGASADSHKWVLSRSDCSLARHHAWESEVSNRDCCAQLFGEFGAVLSDSDWIERANDCLPPSLSALNGIFQGG